MHALGIDIGGSGIKAAPVDTDTGKLLAPGRSFPLRARLCLTSWPTW